MGALSRGTGLSDRFSDLVSQWPPGFRMGSCLVPVLERMIDLASSWCAHILWFGSRQSQSTLLFRSYLRRRPTEWGVGGADQQIFVRKVLSSAGIQSAVWVASLSAISPTWSNRQEGTSRDALPQMRLTPHTAPISCGQALLRAGSYGTAWTPLGYIQKWDVQ
jgi:hypothetical protein